MKNLILPIAIGVCILAAAVYAQTTYTNTKLAAVDSTKPLGSAIISQGDDEIRALKAALLDWADDEHLLNGAHATNFFRQYMAGTNSIPGYAVSNLTASAISTNTITVSNLVSSLQKPLIYISSVETDSALYDNSTTNFTLGTLICPSNTYSKILIEAEVDYVDGESAEACVFSYHFIEGASTTNKSFRTQTPADSQTKGVMRISTIFNGGQTVATTNRLISTMSESNADHETYSKNIRLWGIP